MSRSGSPHRWSGWPGAWCLDCGAECQAEVCLSLPDHVGQVWDEHGLAAPCPDHTETECPEPGSHKHDPYHTKPKPVCEGSGMRIGIGEACPVCKKSIGVLEEDIPFEDETDYLRIIRLKAHRKYE